MKVLFIDDDSMILRMAGFIMKKGGHEALTAGSCDEGIAQIQELSPQMAFIDVEMPEKNGFETLEAIRAEGLGLRVWMMSGTVTEEVVARAKSLGAEGVIEKPLNAAEVYSALEEKERRG